MNIEFAFAETYIFQDSIEGELLSWSIITDYAFENRTTTYVSSPYSLYAAINGDYQGSYGHHSLTTDYTHFAFEVWVRPYPGIGSSNHMYWGTVTAGSVAAYVGVTYVAGNKVTFHHYRSSSQKTASNASAEYTIFTWLHVKTYVDLIHNTMVTYVNDVKILSDTYNRPNTAPNIFVVDVYAGSTTIPHALYMDDINVTNEYAPNAFQITPYFELENIDDSGGDWVFTNYKYYEFLLEANSANINNMSMFFVVPTGLENIGCGFFANETYTTYLSNMSENNPDGEPVILKQPSVYWDVDEELDTTRCSWLIWFSDRILDVYDPDDCIDVWFDYNSSGWYLGEDNLFRIYSAGGFTQNYESDSYFRAYLLEGSPFSFHAENGTSVYNEIWYRDLQHIKLLPDIYCITDSELFLVEYGIDYSIGEGEWLTGWSMIFIADGITGTGAPEVWINGTAYMYDGNGEVGSTTVYMFRHGENLDKTGVHFKLWVDLWISEANASSVGAGRINAYEYAMQDNAEEWLRWLVNNWGVKDNATKEYSSMTSLLDGSGNVMSSQQIQMVRVWCNVTVGDVNEGQIIEVRDYSIFDTTRAATLPLLGVSAPVFDETKIPTMEQQGLLGSIWSALSGAWDWLANTILFGGLNLWGHFVNFLDSIAAMLGAPHFFSNLFDAIAEFLVYVVTSLEYIVSVAGGIFDLFGSLLSAFVLTVADLITSLVNMISGLISAFAGAYSGGVNIWNQLGISSWITLALIMYPLYLLLLWEEKGIDAVVQQLTWIFGLLSWIFGFMWHLIQLLISMVQGIIESIPIAE